MDLGAYTQIGDIDIQKIVEDKGISVPRLRGYRLMSEEEPVTENEIADIISNDASWIYEKFVCSSPVRFRPQSHGIEFSATTDRLREKYLIKDDGRVVGIRWNLIHGRNRKELKFALKKSRKRIMDQYSTFNKYAGHSNVLYIHARIGGNNWNYYGGHDIEKQSWFIEKVDDSSDVTYCDIYADIS